MMEQPTPIGQHLRALRERAGLTQEQLAERSGVSVRSISDIERGSGRIARLDTLTRLAQALGLSPQAAASFRAAARARSETSPMTVEFTTGPAGAAGAAGGADGSAAVSGSTLRAGSDPARSAGTRGLIGREHELEEVIDLLWRDTDPGARILTLVGPGGVGKTRLALAVAERAHAHFRDGVVLVPLSALRDATFVLATVTGALGLREEPGQQLEAILADHLRGKHLLLVLDNCEHVVAAMPQISALADVCPQLAILATSRIALRVRGEQVFAVAPLATPAIGFDPHTGDLTTLAAVPAVALFIARARDMLPNFRLTLANAAAIAALCRMLDGLPLAIELAASWMRLLTPTQLLERLHTPLTLLARGPRDAPARQRTLRATLIWSYALLPPTARMVFRRLAPFAGGFTIEAAEAVCSSAGGSVGPHRGETGVDRQDISQESEIRGAFIVDEADEADEADEGGILDALATLADHSLVQRLSDPETGRDAEANVGETASRWQMLETVRAYAREQLAAFGEERASRRSHATYYAALAERAEAELIGPNGAEWVARLSVEQDNLRAALGWALTDDEGREVAARLAAALWRYWEMSGQVHEGRTWVEHVLALTRSMSGDTHAARYGPAPPLLPDALLARVLTGAGMLAFRGSDFDAAVTYHRRALRLRRRAGDRWGMSSSLNNLGIVAEERGTYARADRLFAHALALLREVGDQVRQTTVLLNLANIAYQRADYARAVALGEEALEIARAVASRRGEATALYNLAESLRLLDPQAHPRVAALCAESSALLEELGEVWGKAYPIRTLGCLALTSGDVARAVTLFEASLELSRACGDERSAADVLVYLGRAALAQQDAYAAGMRFREGLTVYVRLRARRGVAQALGGLAAAAQLGGDPAKASRLAGAAAMLCEALGIPLAPDERGYHEWTTDAARAALGEHAYATAWGDGHAHAWEIAVALAGGVSRQGGDDDLAALLVRRVALSRRGSAER